MMEKANKDKIIAYLDKMGNMESEEIMATVDKYLDDDTIEEFVNHIEEFYGVDDDEQLGVLAQIMISGYIIAKESGA